VKTFSETNNLNFIGKSGFVNVQMRFDFKNLQSYLFRENRFPPSAVIPSSAVALRVTSVVGIVITTNYYITIGSRECTEDGAAFATAVDDRAAIVDVAPEGRSADC
jgi:hypothetical protein